VSFFVVLVVVFKILVRSSDEKKSVLLEVSKKFNDSVGFIFYRDAAKVATNYSIQLKIICAVKAGSPAEDPTAKKSLVLSAQGLAKSVIECVNISQIAKLKKKLR
jgi:hypothetical protein